MRFAVPCSAAHIPYRVYAACNCATNPGSFDDFQATQNEGGEGDDGDRYSHNHRVTSQKEVIASQFIATRITPVIATLFTKKLPKLAPSGFVEAGAGEVGSGVGGVGGVGAIKILAARTIIDSSSVMCFPLKKKAEEVQPVRSWLEVG